MLKLHIISFDCNPNDGVGKTLNSKEEEYELLSVDVGVKSPNHDNLCYLLCGLICLLVDRTL